MLVTGVSVITGLSVTFETSAADTEPSVKNINVIKTAKNFSPFVKKNPPLLDFKKSKKGCDILFFCLLYHIQDL